MKKRHLALGTAGAIGGLIAWKMLTRARTVNFADFADRIAHAENSHFAEVDGMTVHYQEFGDAANPTLILIHGYTSSTYVWRKAAPRFAEAGFHVVAVDLLGFGFSEKPAWFDYSIASQARVLVRLMNVLGIGRATLVGSSFGGAVASTVALDYKERVEKLVLIGSVCNDDVKNQPILKLAAIPLVGEVITPFLTDSKAFMRHRMKNTLAPENHHLITDERIENIIRPLKAADAHHAILQTARSWEACRIETDAQFIEQPTLLVWGDKDRVIPMQNGERLHNSILNSRFVVFKNCGHIPQEENPGLFVDLVAEFCRDSKGRIDAKDDKGISDFQS
ncbi:MAG TPA: alpha/beta hydrolase [Pyrinomonadaceae bacterium]|nr:alpha/beta hydrolase [Pyrinomonadaceae bacterium]